MDKFLLDKKLGGDAYAAIKFRISSNAEKAISFESQPVEELF